MDRSVRLDDTGGAGCSWCFSGRVATLMALSPAEVVPLLTEVDTATAAGRYAVGFVAYEAASALNPDLPFTPPQEGLPLAWFAVFEHRHALSEPTVAVRCDRIPIQFATMMEKMRYIADVSEIRQRIAAGECYQANYTMPLTAEIPAHPELLYRQIIAAQQAGYCAWLDTGRFLIMSASPELFFRKTGNRIVTRPMKGTAPRGRSRSEDASFARLLATDPKERAENLMIVDLLRNDLGMVAENGSVCVESLFDVETYPTLHQMTSTISARLLPDIGLVKLFRALFPCGSITGAPKRKTMEILDRLEGRPRGVYCGAIGMLGPGGEAVFSVAIRTLVCDREQGIVEMGVGSGITWDSDPEAEFSECLSKGEFASRSCPASGLIESLRCEQGTYARMERHLDRMAWSAGRIGIGFDSNAAAVLLKSAAGSDGMCKVRLLLSPDGALSVTCGLLEEHPELLRIAISTVTVDPDDLSLCLKLSDRSRYEQARCEHPAADEVLFVNSRGELTEGTYHNLVLNLHGRLVTPPLSSGLLPGVMREVLLEEGVISEQILYPRDLEDAEEIWLINSVRGWRKGIL